MLFSDDILRSDKFAAKYEASDSKEYQHMAPEGYLTLRDGFSLAHREFARWDHWDFHRYHEDKALYTCIVLWDETDVKRRLRRIVDCGRGRSIFHGVPIDY